MVLLIWLFFHLQSADMTVRISNVQSTQGVVRIAIFNKSEGFLATDKACFLKVADVGGAKTLDILFPDAPAGYYAVSCYHDVNNNGKLDKNMVGVPTEPYGFSNQARPKFRAPYWDEARFRYEPGKTSVQVRLEKW